MLLDPRSGKAAADNFTGFNLFNYDLRSINDRMQEDDTTDGPVPSISQIHSYLVIETNDSDLTLHDLVDTPSTTIKFLLLQRNGSTTGTVSLSDSFDGSFDAAFYEAFFDDATITATDRIGLAFFINDGDTDFPIILDDGDNMPIVADFFSFGYILDGVRGSERISNQIIRMQLEETGDNTATFVGTLEYVMINQLNIQQNTTFTGLTNISDEPTFIAIDDLTDEDSPRINYLDLGEDGVSTQIADQQEAPSHSGVVSFDSSTYKVADTVVITLDDQDLNVGSDLIEIYTVVDTSGDASDESVGQS